MKTQTEIFNRLKGIINNTEVLTYGNAVIAMSEYANQSKWISVSDGMPPLGDTVLAYTEAEGIKECKIATYQKGSIGYIKGRKDIWFEYITHNNYSMRYNATHWQALPEKP